MNIILGTSALGFYDELYWNLNGIAIIILLTVSYTPVFYLELVHSIVQLSKTEAERT